MNVEWKGDIDIKETKVNKLNQQLFAVAIQGGDRESTLFPGNKSQSGRDKRRRNGCPKGRRQSPDEDSKPKDDNHRTPLPTHGPPEKSKYWSLPFCLLPTLSERTEI